MKLYLLLVRFHSCDLCATQCVEDTRERDRKKITDLSTQGRCLVMRECVWRKKRQLGLKSNPAPFTRSPYSSFYYDKDITKAKILKGVCDGTFFGLLEVDIVSPDAVKQRFKEINFPPLFDRIVVDRKHLSQSMLAKCDAAKMKFPTRPQLSLTYSAKNYMISSEALQFYLEIGLRVTGATSDCNYLTYHVYCRITLCNSISTRSPPQAIHGRSD